MVDELERVFTVPLRPNKNVPRTKRAPHAIKVLRAYVAKHMHAKPDDVWIDPKLSEMIWKRGKFKVQSSVRIRAIRFEDELVEVSLPEE